MESAEKNLIALQTAEKLVSAHDGDVALLYIWLQLNGRFDETRAATELCRTLSEIRAAYEKLGRICGAEQEHREAEKPELPPEDELPEYTSADVMLRSKTDGTFGALVAEAQRLKGSLLSTPELKKLFGIYDYLDLPPDVIMLLLNFCCTDRRFSMSAINKEAYVWHNSELLTSEMAEEYIASLNARRSAAGRLKTAFGIRDRELSSTEQRYVMSWLDMGFEHDAIMIAYDRTVTNTGSLKWAYMNKILLSWHEKKLHTAAEIGAKDRRTENESDDRAADGDELERLRRIRDRVKNA